MHATSINPIDAILRAGHLAQLMPMTLPVIPGRDCVGVGPGVTDMHVADVVFGLAGVSDTTAEFAVLTAWAAVPEMWPTSQAPAAGLASVAAGVALDAPGDLNGKTLLIEGASGAVGSAAAVLPSPLVPRSSARGARATIRTCSLSVFAPRRMVQDRPSVWLSSHQAAWTQPRIPPRLTRSQNCWTSSRIPHRSSPISTAKGPRGSA